MTRPHRILILLFALTVASQVLFTTDVIRTLRGDYAVQPLTLGDPWASIVSLSKPAEEVGLRIGDSVIAIDGRTPRGTGELARAVHERHPHGHLAITVVRGGRPEVFDVPFEAFSMWWTFAFVTLIFMPWLSILLGFWVTAM